MAKGAIACCICWRVRPLYVLGQFVTRQSADLELTTDERLKYLLGEWKQNQKTLQLQRLTPTATG